MRIGNIRIGYRLGLGFGLVVTLLMFVVFVGISRLSSLNSAMSNLVNDSYPKTVLANHVIDNVNVIARNAGTVLMMTDFDQSNKLVAEIVQARKAEAGVIDGLDKTIKTEKGRAVFNQMLAARGKYAESLDQFLKLLDGGDKAGASDFLITNNLPLQQTYTGWVRELISFQNQLMENAGQAAHEEYQSSRLLMIILSGVAMLMAIAITLFVTRSIVLPLSQAVKVAETVAAGDLTSHLTLTAPTRPVSCCRL